MSDVEGARETPPAEDGPPVYVIGFWRRVAAGLLDFIVMAPVLLAAAWLAFRIIGLSVPSLRPAALIELMLSGTGEVYGVAGVLTLISLVYGFFFVAIAGGTPGLRLFRCRVVNIYGERPEWWRVLLRNGGVLVGFLLFGLGLLWIGFDREKRGLHDWIAGTYVVRRSPA